MLSGKQRSFLRAEGNKLDPIIHVGKEGVTTSLIEQVEESLIAHELIKGRVLNNSSKEARQVANLLAEKCNADVVQVIGNVFLIYRYNVEEPTYILP